MKIAVLSDTHAPKRWKSCPAPVADELLGVGAILHAGDVCTVDVLEELAAFAPVYAVLGNNDGPEIERWGAQETWEGVFEGVRVAMIHDSGTAEGRLERLRRRFPEADLVVFGHSHIPVDLVADGIRIFNPGSPTDRRRQDHGTMGMIEIGADGIRSVQTITVT